MVLTRILEVWYNKKFITNHEIVISLTFASIYSNRDLWYNAFIRQLYRNGAIHMKKFLVPVSYAVWGRVEVESESIEQLLDDLRHQRLDLPILEYDEQEYVDDSYELDVDSEIIDTETDERFGF
jgi:hypothetical protein